VVPGRRVQAARPAPHPLRPVRPAARRHEGLPENRTETPGLFLAGEYTEDSSINGSMLSGEKAALEVLG
jgi:hypothetical protein